MYRKRLIISKEFIYSFYILLSFAYYFVSTNIRVVLFMGVLFLSFWGFIFAKKKEFVKQKNGKLFLLLIVFLFCGVFIQMANSTFTPFIIYLLSAPCFAYFIYHTKFDLKKISIPFYFIVFFFIGYYVYKRTFDDVFHEMSRNYVSVVMIMNTVLLLTIEWRQTRKANLLPAFLCFMISAMALGRSGIICSALILLNVAFLHWKNLNKNAKIIYVIAFVLPIFLLIAIKWNSISVLIEYSSVYEHFYEKGIDSPSRDILKRTYLENLSGNWYNIIFGYNFKNDPWFIHYGLNPHNSYIRLHYYLGSLFFIVSIFIIVTSWKLIQKNLFLFINLLAILLRGWTDSCLFLTIYDFVLIYYIMISFYLFETKNYMNYGEENA